MLSSLVLLRKSSNQNARFRVNSIKDKPVDNLSACWVLIICLWMFWWVNFQVPLQRSYLKVILWNVLRLRWLVFRYRCVVKKSTAGLYFSPNKNKYNGKICLCLLAWIDQRETIPISRWRNSEHSCVFLWLNEVVTSISENQIINFTWPKQCFFWDRHKHVAGLNRLMGFPTLSSW